MSKIVEKAKELESLLLNKNIYVKSMLQSVCDDSSLNDESVSYFQMHVTSVEFGPDYFYIYGVGKDRIIFNLHGLKNINREEGGNELVLTNKWNRLQIENVITILE